MGDADDPLAGIRLLDAPILLFVAFHKAFRGELSQLRQLAVEALEIGGGGRSRPLVNAIFKRFQFLKLVYQYHCAAEDEVIFLALDGRVKNVAYTYSLEHRSIDDLFSSLFNYLSSLVEAEQDVTNSYKELVSRIRTIQTSVCNHMYKEEKQLFPMIIRHFAPEEQSPLVWQFICSVPVGLLEDFFPWVTYFLPPNEQVDVLQCMQVIVPNERFLQKVFFSWLNDVNVEGRTKCGQFNQIWNGPATDNALPKFYYKGSFDGWSNPNNRPQTNTKHFSVALHIWHGAILKDFTEILVELYQARALDSFSSVTMLITQLKFLADLVIFYRNTLDKLVYPILNGFAKNCLYDPTRWLITINNIENLQHSLYNHVRKGMTVHTLVEKICWEVDSFLKVISKHFTFLETEVVPIVTKVCSFDTQQSILYASLHMMPLGLLKCTITWFMVHLSEVELKSILCFIREGAASVLNGNFASLLNGWIRGGFSGKSSIETFRKDLDEMFSCRCSYITELAGEITGSSSLNSDVRRCNKTSPMAAYSRYSGNSSNFAPTSSSFRFCISEKHSTLYSSGINMRVFYPSLLTTLHSSPELLTGSNDLSSLSFTESRPMDYLVFFHKALKKNLEYLADKAYELAESGGSLEDFIQRFKLLHILYQLHSDAEDEIAFPALEAKGEPVENISCSYTIDHKLEADHFNMISELIDVISLLVKPSSAGGISSVLSEPSKYKHLCGKLHDMCMSMNKALFDHIDREETELWPLFSKHFSTVEQEKIVGYMLGRLNAEILQQILPWLMSSLTPEEQKGLILIWRRATKNTKFSEWLRAWWGGISKFDVFQSVGEPNMFQASTTDALEVVSAYLSEHGLNEREGRQDMASHCGVQKSSCGNGKILNDSLVEIEKSLDASKCNQSELHIKSKHEKCDNAVDVVEPYKDPGQTLGMKQRDRHQEKLSTMSQEELEIVIRKISRDSSLDSKKKSYMMQNLLMSRWIVTQRSQSEEASSEEGAIPGQYASYHDPLIQTFGCKHYRRNCKLLAACCSQLYTCIRCHDEEADHSIDRETITQMLCMRCLVIQPIGSTCSTSSCNSYSMGKYYCSICKLFYDGREIYHCPYCNLCRLGRGLGIDFFHCMNCNACMSRSLLHHVCREKCFEDNCPICHEYIFTSSSPIKALPCGHLMHSSCFQDYTCAHYTCPICSKSLGDMQVYFGMLDAMLAEEKIPDEYSDKNQLILCNDCGKRATTPYHWMYHKCPSCGSYNTRLL